MAQLSDIIPLVKERCGGVLDKFALDHLKRAYQKFCAESKFLFRSQQFDQGDATELVIDDDHVFGGVFFVIDAYEKELKAGTDFIVDTSGELQVKSNIPSYTVFYFVSPKVIMPDSFEANDTIINRWADYLADGAASTLMKMPNTAWTDFNISEYYHRKFIDGYREAYRVAVNALDEQRPKQKRVFY